MFWLNSPGVGERLLAILLGSFFWVSPAHLRHFFTQYKLGKKLGEGALRDRRLDDSFRGREKMLQAPLDRSASWSTGQRTRTDADPPICTRVRRLCLRSSR